MAPPDGLFFDQIIKTFGGTHALRGVSLRDGRGKIVALLGENGAGKSTLIKVLGGIHGPDGVQVSVDGTPYPNRAFDHVTATKIRGKVDAFAGDQ